MTPNLEAYRSMIHLHESPRQMRNISDLRFRELLNDLQASHYKVQPKYEVSFEKAITDKRKFFIKRMENIAIDYLNAIHLAVKESSGDKQKTFHVYTALSRTLPALMGDLNQLMETCNYSESLFKPQQGKIQLSAEADEAFVFEYLKHQLIRLYLEISEAYPNHRKNQALELDELYMKYFQSVPPLEAVINDAPKMVIEQPISEREFPVVDNTFRAITGDVRNTPKGIFTYSQIIKNPSQFARFEEQLFLNLYINKDYQFLNKRGQKSEMAAIYNILIKKNYFNPRVFSPNQSIEETDIVRFLDFRYNISPSTDKLFRNFRKEPKRIADFQDKNSWTRHILPC